MAMANAQVWRERIDTMERDILKREDGSPMFRTAEEHLKHGHKEEWITDPKWAWLMSKDDFDEYYAECQFRIKNNGWQIAGECEGHCPALVAEHLQTQAEWALILAAEEFFPGVTNDKLLCGTQDTLGLECRQKYLDLLVKLVVNAPGYRNPLTKQAVA